MIAPQRVTAALRIRAGAPSTAAPRLGAFQPGAIIHPDAQVVGEAVAGNATWFQLPESRFVWGGGCAPAPATIATPSPMTVSRRDDGTLRPLAVATIEEVFGSLPYEEAGGGRIKVGTKWVERNLEELETPLLDAIGPSRITVHAKAKEPFRRVFDAIETAGLNEIIREYGGCWVPRHMGWNPARKLSSHSWGIAIDLNVRWNGYGKAPAPMGTIGSVREIVSLFEAEGFAWGGYFQPLSICDGMHFELARTDL